MYIYMVILLTFFNLILFFFSLFVFCFVYTFDKSVVVYMLPLNSSV